MQVNNSRNSWFPTPCGEKQGDLLSPTLFTLYLNDLVQELKQAIDDVSLSVLLYEDNNVLLSETE